MPVSRFHNCFQNLLSKFDMNMNEKPGIESKTHVVLAEVCPLTHPMIPSLMIHCIIALERDRIHSDGIYRLPGSENAVNRLFNDFVKTKTGPILFTHIETETITGCIKKFLNRLDDALIPKSLFDKFQAATETFEDKKLIKAVLELPPPNRDTLAYFVQHLQTVSRYANHNNMPQDSLSKVLAPLIVGAPVTDNPQEVFRHQFTILYRLMKVSQEFWKRVNLAGDVCLTELHLQLADTYRTSGCQRCNWFDTLATSHMADGWYAEAAICQAHSFTIIARELVSSGSIKLDWKLLDVLNDRIAFEENVFSSNYDEVGNNFTIKQLMHKGDALIQTLFQAQRYEAIGPIARLIIPIYERNNNHKALMKLYKQLQESSQLADEVQTKSKRHLGTYFRVVFYSKLYFQGDHKAEYIYREKGATSLAEACDKLISATAQHLGHDRVLVLPENKVSQKKLKNDYAYIQLTHVEPCLKVPEICQEESIYMLDEPKCYDDIFTGDPLDYFLHTNVRHFYYEETYYDERTPTDAPEIAKLSLKRIYLTVQEPFPNTCRRQRVSVKNELLLDPLEFACDKLCQKGIQIRKFLAAVGFLYGVDMNMVDEANIRKVDVKGLQCCLQGAVQPTVNAGVLAYAEAFSMPHQRKKYGKDGIEKLVLSFKILMTEVKDALEVNERVIGGERQEYLEMLKRAFEQTIQRLREFFGNQDFVFNNSEPLKRSYEIIFNWRNF